ncbi:MAG: four helix bundle protein [Desulfobacterales bacterium]|jgi:four helix bundle protein
MPDKDLKERTKKFALKIIKLAASPPRTREADIIGRQLLKAGTSVGANYREANRARSKAEFRAKIGIVEQESDESLYWLELLKESGITKGRLLEELLIEADELVAIFTTIGKQSKLYFRIPSSEFMRGGAIERRILSSGL